MGGLDSVTWGDDEEVFGIPVAGEQFLNERGITVELIVVPTEGSGAAAGELTVGLGVKEAEVNVRSV